MKVSFDDDEDPPIGWQPPQELLSRLESLPSIDLDAHLGNAMDAARGAAWLEKELAGHDPSRAEFITELAAAVVAKVRAEVLPAVRACVREESASLGSWSDADMVMVPLPPMGANILLQTSGTVTVHRLAGRFLGPRIANPPVRIGPVSSSGDDDESEKSARLEQA